MTVTAERFKQVLGRWATGVTIVTTRLGDQVHGMTVSSFNEVSLDPPLVLFCADNKSETLKLVESAEVFAVNVLAHDQAAVSNRFASKKHEWTRFEGIECETGVTGSPLLVGALAHLDCRVEASHNHGDHTVYIGHVVDARWSERQPLLYFRGGYGQLLSD